MELLLNNAGLIIAIAFALSITLFAKYIDFLGNNMMLGFVINFLAVYGLILLVKDTLHIEGMTNMSKYPSNGKHLLGDMYPLKQPIKMSSDNYTDAWKNRAIYTNMTPENQRDIFWKTPTNGNCIPTELCNSFYGDLTEKEMSILQEETLPPTGGKRIGAFRSV